MEDTVCDIHGVRVLVCAPDGRPLSSERDANSIMSAAWESGATTVTIPVERLSAEFLQLSTRLAGEITQKFVNYHLRLVIVGDISKWIADSKALRDFVYESNRRREIWFVQDMVELERRVASANRSPQP